MSKTERPRLLYSDIYNQNKVWAETIIDKYGEGESSWKRFRAIYVDPDSFCIDENGYKKKGDIICTVDALLSAWRIYNHEGFNKEFIEAYEQYRKEPIFFFPREQGGINQSRAAFFGDRIDHFLFDLKRYCSGEESKLESVYQKEKTKKWLESFGKVNGRPNFSEIADWYQIVGVFVNADYEVFDLEKDDESVISNYCDEYISDWTEEYYNNLKIKIDMFMTRSVEK